MDENESYDKFIVERHMRTMKGLHDIFDELFAYDTGDDYWKKVVCEACYASVEGDMDDWEVQSAPDELALAREKLALFDKLWEPYKDLKPKTVNLAVVNEKLTVVLKNFMDGERVEDMDRAALNRLVSSCFFLLAKICPTAYSTDYSRFMEMVKEKGIQRYADEVVAFDALYERYQG